MEVGCGVGNAAIPLLEAHPKLTVYAMDFAASAISILQVRRCALPPGARQWPHVRASNMRW